MSDGDRNYYEVLELPRNSSMEDVRASFRRMSLWYHPDRDRSPGAAKRYREIQEAYRVLSDPASKAAYDRATAGGGRQQPPLGGVATPPSGTQQQPPLGGAATPPSGAATPLSGARQQPPSGGVATPPSGTQQQPPSGGAATPADHDEDERSGWERWRWLGIVLAGVLVIAVIAAILDLNPQSTSSPQTAAAIPRSDPTPVDVDDIIRQVETAVAVRPESVTATVPAPTPTAGTSVADLVDKARPSVVRIVGEYGAGTGFVVAADGHILTNFHVVVGEPRLVAVLHDGAQLSAQVVSEDPARDIALLKVKTNRSLVPLTFARSVREGEDVIALGYPLDLRGSMTITRGIVSAVRRANGIELVQTDAAINPGNSGGPLLNDRGEVVGMNTFVHLDAQGIGFAVSAEVLKARLNVMR